MSGKYCSLIKNKELDVMPDDVAWGVDAVKIGCERLVSVVAALPDGTVRLFQVITISLHHLNISCSCRRLGFHIPAHYSNIFVGTNWRVANKDFQKGRSRLHRCAQNYP